MGWDGVGQGGLEWVGIGWGVMGVGDVGCTGKTGTSRMG